MTFLHLPCIPPYFSLVLIVPLYFFSGNPICLFSNFLFQCSDLIFKTSVEDFGFENPLFHPKNSPCSVHRLFPLSSQQPSFLAMHSLSYHLEYTVVLLGFYSCILLLFAVASSAVSWVTGLFQSSEAMHLGVSPWGHWRGSDSVPQGLG